MDRITRGLAAYIRLLIEQVEGGNALTHSDIRSLVGKEGLAAYEQEVSDARKERDRRRKTLVDINDGNVPDYLDAVERAKAAMVQQLKDGDTFNSKAKIGTAKHREAEKAWKARRAKSLVLQEQVDEYWEAVEERFHEAFHEPPEGGWGDKGAAIAELQWPPRLLKTQLEYRPEPHLLNVPLHQQRELLVRELAELEPALDQPEASASHLQARASMLARASR